MDNQSCCGSEHSCPGEGGARVLSQAATQEILGDHLALLIAIDKHGKPVRYVPYGSSLSAGEALSQENTDSILDISIRVPKQGNEATTTTDATAEAGCWCRIGGVWVRC